VTARLISDVLITMWKHRYHQTFFDSLSIAGKDGTLRSRMKDLPTEFHGKTGFIGGVRSLSGYVKNRSGEWYVVSMIFNGIEGSVKPVEEMQDGVVKLLAESER
jgi:D-alanyl-D-alanine carboxypeptidase/D-alanyl-D-alanine-endopeptidase (penicillin-binding protein 4)